MNNMSEKRKLSESNESSKRTKQPIDQLTLTKEPSIFVGTTFNEAVDKEIFIKLMHSKQLLTQMPADATGKWVEMKQRLGLDNEFEQFLKLYEKMHGDTISVWYNASKHGWGRVSPGGGLSLGLVRCEPRHTVAKDLYVDIDMKNCFPSILHQLCIRHKIECPKLSKYVEQREEWLERLQNTHYNTEEVSESGSIPTMPPSIGRKPWLTLLFTKDISFGWITSYLIGIYLICIYGILANLPPIWGPVLLEIFCGTALMVLKVKLDLFEKKSYSRTIGTQTGADVVEESASRL
eukprot:g3596.t1